MTEAPTEPLPTPPGASDAASPPAPPPAATAKPKPPALPPEIGGPKGPEPTRFGDWEQKGRCTDF